MRSEGPPNPEPISERIAQVKPIQRVTTSEINNPGPVPLHKLDQVLEEIATSEGMPPRPEPDED